MNDRIDFAILDSGTGGIPYMMDIKNKRPDLRCVYLGDTANFPYGQKSYEEVIEASSGAVSKIIERWKPECIVIACNTISVTALDELRKRFAPLKFIGTVPAIRLASRVTRNKRIGLLATNATVNHPYCQKLVKDFASDCTLYSRGDPDLVAFVEHRYFKADEEEKLAAVKKAVDFFREKECDTVILGCTHFTHIAKEFEKACGDDITVIDSRNGVSNQAIKVRFDGNETVHSENDHKTNIIEEKSMKLLPPDMSFFVTSLEKKEDEEEYAELCDHFGIPWGGLLQ